MDSYPVWVNLNAPEPTPQQLDILMEWLQAYNGSWGINSHGRLQARLSVPGATLRDAMSVGIALVTDAVQATGLGMPDVVGAGGDVDEMPTAATPPRMLSAIEVARRLGVSRQAVVKRACRLGGEKIGRVWVFNAEHIEALATAKKGGVA